MCVLGLEFDQTLQVRCLTGLGVTLVVGEELHQVLLLVGGEEVQEPHGVGVQSLDGQRGIQHRLQTFMSAVKMPSLMAPVSHLLVILVNTHMPINIYNSSVDMQNKQLDFSAHRVRSD